MSEIILHHYPTSPYAEKARLALGLKGVSWRSVKVPMVAPKPELTPLTGGYRRTPVMQIGADIYCDTLCILRELEQRYPAPSLYPNGDVGTAHALAWWAEKSLFNTAVGIAFGEMEGKLPEGFEKDRSEMSGREVSASRLKTARPILVDQLRAHLGFLENILKSKSYLLGDKPGLADLSAYHPIWFIQRNCKRETSPLSDYPAIAAWLARIAAIGHGKSQTMNASEALEIAKAAAPSLAEQADSRDPGGRKPGQRVKVTPDDFGRIPVFGTIVASSPDEITIRREDERVGEVLVHFPRAGFIVTPA